MENIEKVCSYALSKIFIREPRLAAAIIRNLGDAESIFRLDRESLFEALGPYNRYRDIIASTSVDKEAEELAKVEKGGISYMYFNHPLYPEPLAECEDAPAGFFVRSSDSFENIFGRESIAVVGTRNMTSYGREWCERIVEALSEFPARPTIVSGLAYGVDITAHLEALRRGLPTIAVLGNGIDFIYPVRHEGYARRITETPRCAVISEYPPGSDVLATNFLCRNRIIAGLSRATILVESRIKGGGMTTARQASSYDRDVFAVPGRNDDPMSQGCNLLIQTKVAEAAIDCDTISKSLGYRRAHTPESRIADLGSIYEGKVSGKEMELMVKVLLIIRSKRDISIDEIAENGGLSYRNVMAAIGRLEADGLVCVDLLQRCSIKKG